MNKRFKKVISSVLAAVMTLGVVSVANVSSVFAAINTDAIDTKTTTVWNMFGQSAKEKTEISGVGSSTTDKLTYVSAGAGTYNNVEVKSSATSTGVGFTVDSSAVAPKFNKSTTVADGNYVSIPVQKNDKIYIYAYTNSNNKNSIISVFTGVDYANDCLDTKEVTTYREVKEYKFDIPNDFTGDTAYITYSDKKSVSTSSGASTLNIAAVARVRENSTEPSLKLSPNTLSIAPGDSSSVTATIKNITGDVSWAFENTVDGISVDSPTTSNNTSTATVTVASNVEVGTTATLKATAGTKTETVTVNVVSASNDIYIKGAIGLKSLTLTNGKNDYTVEWKRSGSNAASEDYNYSTVKTRNYVRKIADAPLATYTVKEYVVDDYYTAQFGKESFELTASDEYSSTSPTLTVTTTRNSDNTAFDYTAAAGKTATWDFTTKTGASNEYLNIQGTATKVYSNVDGIFMTVNGAKFNSVDRAGDVQVNSGTTLEFNVTNGTTISIEANNGEQKFTVGDTTINSYTDAKNEDTEGYLYTYSGENGTVTFTAGNSTKSDGTESTSGYIKSITVTYPESTATTAAPTKVAADKVSYVKVGDVEYAIAVIDGANVDDDSIASFYVQDSAGENKSADNDTVYESIRIGDTTYDKSDFTTAKKAYLYAFKVTGDEDSDIATIIAKATVGYNATTATQAD